MSFHSKFHTASITYRLFHAAAFAAALGIAPAAHAVLYWDANSNLAGTGTWDTTTVNWRTTNTVGAPDSTWTPNDGTQDAVFGGDPGAGTAGSGLGGPNGRVTVSGTVNVNSITLAAAPTPPSIAVVHYSISGGAINITSPTNSIVMNTNTSGTARTQIIKSAISGTDITVVANAVAGTINSFLTLGGNPDGRDQHIHRRPDLRRDLRHTEQRASHQIAIDNPTALPATATVRMKRNICQLLFGGGGAGGTTGYTATFNNNIILNDGGSGTFTQGIGAFAATTVITLGGVISGNANLVFELGAGGGNGTIVLANNATYTGNTNINANTTGEWSVWQSTTLFLSVPRLSSTGAQFDMAGFNQRVGGLTSGTGGSQRFITNTGAATSDADHRWGCQWHVFRADRRRQPLRFKRQHRIGSGSNEHRHADAHQDVRQHIHRRHHDQRRQTDGRRRIPAVLSNRVPGR